MAETLATPRVLIRVATADDDLSRFMVNIPGHWFNHEMVLVADSVRGIEGMVCLFDSGHSLIFADHLLLSQGAPDETGPQLILAVNAYCQTHGKKSILLVTGDLKLAYLAQRRGAVPIGPMYRIRYDVTDKEGAKHA